jgi:hypothetical protein
VWGRSAERWLECTEELSHLGFAMYQFPWELDVFVNPRIDDYGSQYVLRD